MNQRTSIQKKSTKHKGRQEMKVFFKIALLLVAIAGVAYWLLSKCAWPATRLKAYRARRQQEVDELLEPENEG